MLCWPDIWDRAKQELPVLEVYGSLLAYVAIVALLLWAPKIRRPQLKRTLRVVGGIIAVPLALIIPVFLFGAALAGGNPPARTRATRSSSGNEATLIYHAGFLGRDYTEVKLKRVGCCRHQSVFWHSGPSSFDDPRLEWLDSKHLGISFHSRPEDPSHCEQQLADVVITCTKRIWPQTPNDSEAGVAQHERKLQ